MQGVRNPNGILAETIMQGYLLGSRTVITATGTSTYTPPANCKLLLVECIGGGGGGRQASVSSAGQATVCAGGVGGSYATAVVAPFIGNPFTAVVNAGGASNAAGGSTSFAQSKGSLLTLCLAGGGDFPSAGLATGTSELFINNVAALAFTAVGDVTTANQFSLAGHRVSGSVALSGKGGAGPFGGQAVASKTGGTGAAGGKYGAGGAGGMSINASSPSNGGHGGQGLIIVWEWF